VAEFQELIKNFDRIRDYMRQFYVYGFKMRNDFEEKSARTYDNERRRIESWLSDYMRSDYSAKGKRVYINVDSKAIPENPLYAAWKAKSFTDNDIMLHFFLLDQLYGEPEGLSAGELGDRMSECYGTVFDSQTIRLKLREYEALGILRAVKQGKTRRYALEPAGGEEAAESAQAGKQGSDLDREEVGHAKGRVASRMDAPEEEGGLSGNMAEAVKFYQGAAPFGVIGSTLLDREEKRNDHFQFKHQFIVHTLEDGVLLDILCAMKKGARISFVNKSSRSKRKSSAEGLPLKIFVSVRTGRRYVCCYQEEARRFVNYRLDCIAGVTAGERCPEYEEKKALLQRNLGRCWGVSFGGRSRLEEICMKVYIDEIREPYILDRLYREGRGGEILRIRENEYLYSGAFFDTNEMLSWVKSFTGRILDIQGSSLPAVMKVTGDWEKMYQMYCKGDAGAV